MAITYVQSQSNTVHGAGSLAATFASDNTAGNLILVCMGAYGGGTGPTVSDSQGNTYTQIRIDAGGSGSGSIVSVWYAENVKAGANTVTVDQTSSADIDLIIAEYSGLSTTAALTASSIAVTAATSISASGVTPEYPNDALILYSYDQTNSGDTFTFTCSPSETFTQREVTSNTGGGESSALVDSIGTFALSALTPSVAISAGHSNALYLVAILLSEGVSVAAELMMLGAWSITSTSQTREAGFGTGAFSYAATGLPPGITLDSSTGAFSGTVSAAGTYTFTVTATDAAGKTVSVMVTASIAAVSPVDTSQCAAIMPGFVA
jgi:large repetitive protein